MLNLSRNFKNEVENFKIFEYKQRKRKENRTSKNKK